MYTALDSTDGYQVVDNYNDTATHGSVLLHKFLNNGTTNQMPVAGDVLSFDQQPIPGTDPVQYDGGHTAIVTGVSVDGSGDGTINILDQNNSNDSTDGTGQLTVTSWVIGTQSGLGSVTGWLDTNTQVSSAAPSGTSFTSLHAVSADAANDVWAVGYAYISSNQYPLIEQWNGSQWSVSQDALLSGQSAGTYYLTGVKAFSPDDVWAVGYNNNGSFIEHWDSGHAWTQVASYSDYSQLYGIDGKSDTDLWAVGISGSSTALTLHRNSGGWSSVSNSGTSSGDYLYGVSELGSSDIWAVGSGPSSHSFTMHYNGSSWSTVSSPNPGPYGNDLHGVAMFGSGDVYAVGTITYSSYNSGVVMHWDGSSWSVVSSVTSYPNNSGLSAIAILPTATTNATNIWTVGNYQGAPLIWHSSDGGTTWDSISTASLPSIGIAGITINGDNGNTWVVSSQVNSTSHQPLTAFYN